MEVMDKKKIVIMTRDINGRRIEYRFDSRSHLVVSHVEIYDKSDEILLVLWGGICIYNALQNTYPITWEDIAGYFA
jgi:hypothetical protein